MIKPLKIEGGGYSYELPLSYFPRYLGEGGGPNEPNLLSATDDDN